MSIAGLYSQQQVQHVQVLSAEPVTTSVPNVVPTPAYPASIEFTVFSTTLADGHYSVYTTTGQTLYLPDFYSWNSLLPHDTYTATITGIETNGALDVGTVYRGFPLVAVSALPGGMPASPYPYIVEFTVMSTGVTNGHYCVRTTAGKKLYLQNYSSWNSLVPGDTYTAIIAGIAVDGVLEIGPVILISDNNSQENTYPESPQKNNVKELPQNWIIRGSSYTGTVTLNPDGTGSAKIDHYPKIWFQYTIPAGGMDGTATSGFWSVPFTYDPVNNVITSPKYPGAELVPTE
ncbi:MAG TPA: hypothetical protein PKM50_06945 [Methanoregula sp.]|nr:hypothetical protein [Methanoregula sp.]